MHRLIDIIPLLKEREGDKKKKKGIKKMKEKKKKAKKSRYLLKYGYPQNVLSIKKLGCKT